MKGLRDYAAAERLVGRRVDRHIAEGDTLPLLAGVCIIDMPGHTLGSIALYVERVAAIIAGDSIVSAGGGLCRPDNRA
jgi:glyoxylase-like metal-dependent hydrolase (beta-lactamase superfamily II)